MASSKRSVFPKQETHQLVACDCCSDGSRKKSHRYYRCFFSIVNNFRVPSPRFFPCMWYSFHSFSSLSPLVTYVLDTHGIQRWTGSWTAVKIAFLRPIAQIECYRTRTMTSWIICVKNNRKLLQSYFYYILYTKKYCHPCFGVV